jgi:asparagine synthase (glutamine-hydrolysing)
MDFGGVGDDRPHLQALCSSLGIEPLRVPPREAVPLIPSVLNADAAPLYWATYPMEMAAIQRAGQVATQALFTGSGGDYVTFGDLSLYADEALRRFVPALWGAARLRTMSSSSRRSRMMDLVLRPAVRKLVPRSWLRRRRANRIRNSRRWAWAGPRLRAFLLDAEDFERDEQEESWYAWLARSRDLVRVADLRGQSERKSQLVERCPYLDANVVEFVASIPREARLCGHDDRGLFREAMRGLLPESIRTRSDKAGFESMLNEVGSGAYATGALSRLVRMEALGDLRLVDPAAFQSALAKAVAEGDGFGWGDAWPALCAEAFLLDESVRRGDPSVWSIEAVN